MVQALVVVEVPCCMFDPHNKLDHMLVHSLQHKVKGRLGPVLVLALVAGGEWLGRAHSEVWGPKALYRVPEHCMHNR